MQILEDTGKILVLPVLCTSIVVPVSRPAASYSQIPCRNGSKSVTSDRNGNMFITRQDEIFIARPTANDYHSILSTTDQIKNPFGIDIDIKSHELFVLNNGGKSVYVFQK